LNSKLKGVAPEGLPLFFKSSFLMDTQTYLDFALKTIKKARSFIEKKKQKGFQTSIKKDNTLVTEVDRETELLIRNAIEQKFPNHCIVGEEFGVTNEGADYQWFLDPIDGTISFTHDIPLYGTILALYHKETPLVSIIDHPSLDLCYYASAAKGTFCNGTKMVIEDIESLEALTQEIIATGDRIQFELSDTMEAYNKLLTKHPLVRTLPDCFGHTLAAKGAVGAMIDFHINVWDIAATRLLVEEAGGKFLLIQKKQLAGGKIKYNMICGKPKVVDWLSEIFRAPF
jgi:histidinol-phosphatase